MNKRCFHKFSLWAASAGLLLALVCGKALVIDAAAASDEASGTVVYDGETYTLPIFGSCGSESGDGYNTWATTLDEEGTPSSDGPRLHAYSSGEWSRFEFYVGGPQPDVNLYMDGDDTVRFNDGVLTYTGPVAEGSSETISIDIRC